jgi:hypothetical protein
MFCLHNRLELYFDQDQQTSITLRTLTMPFERERAIIWGRKFLDELRDSGCLTDERLDFVNALLSRYPLVAVIHGESAWAALPPDQKQAIQEAGIFIREIQSSPVMPADLKRQVPYVLRHFPI